MLEGNKSATKVAKELGIDTNTVCRWVREYREAHQMPTYEVERKIRKQSADELIARNKELEKELRKKEKELADEKEIYNTKRQKFSKSHPVIQKTVVFYSERCKWGMRNEKRIEYDNG